MKLMECNVKKDEIKIEDLADTVAMMAKAIETQNAVILCLLHKFDLNHDLPFWLTKEGLEEDVGPKVDACIESIRRVYGHSKTDKS